MATVQAVLEQEPADPRAVNPAADRDLAAVALKCLAKAPAGRYASAAELADDLDRWARGEATVARPPSLAGLAWRWGKRNATAAVTLPALALVLAVVPWLAAPTAVRRELLPTALDTPLGWTRLLLDTPGLFGAVAAVSGLLTFFSGWLIVRVTRPATTPAAVGFAAGTVLLAHLVSQFFQAPYTFENAREAGVYARFRVHPVADLADGWRAEAARPGTPAAAEADYLRAFLPADRQRLGFDAVADDLYALREEAAQVNRMRAAYRQSAEEVGGPLPVELAATLLATWAVMYLDRSRGRRWANLLVYAELCAAGVLPLGVGWWLLTQAPAPLHWQGVVVGLAVVGLLAGPPLVGAFRRWRWWVRVPLSLPVAGVWGYAVVTAARAGG